MQYVGSLVIPKLGRDTSLKPVIPSRKQVQNAVFRMGLYLPVKPKSFVIRFLVNAPSAVHLAVILFKFLGKSSKMTYFTNIYVDVYLFLSTVNPAKQVFIPLMVRTSSSVCYLYILFHYKRQIYNDSCGLSLSLTSTSQA